jgi:hypothetical protein
MIPRNKTRICPVTMRLKLVYSSGTTETDVVKTAVQDYFVAPFDCDLIMCQVAASAVAGTSAKVASKGVSIGTGTTTIVATTAGDAGNSTYVSLAHSAALNVKAATAITVGSASLIISYATAGTTPNGLKCILTPGGVKGTEVATEDAAGNLIVSYASASSTATEIAAAIDGHANWVCPTISTQTTTGLKSGTLSGGTAACTATESGGVLAVLAKGSTTKTTIAEIEALISLSVGFDASGGSGSFTSTEAFTATALAGGAAAKPTVDIYVNGATVFSGQVGVLVAGTVYDASFTDGQQGSRFSRIKLAKNDKLSMRATTTSSDGQMSNVTASLLFEF